VNFSPQIPQWGNVLCKACGATSIQLLVLVPLVLVLLVPVLRVLVPLVYQEHSY
jgi:hypothetical protein